MLAAMPSGSPRPLPRAHPAAAGLLALMGGCAAPPWSGDSGAPAAAIDLLFPVADEAVRYCSELIVVVDVQGIELTPEAVGGDPVDGQGHWHLLDNETYVVSTAETWAAVQGELALTDGRHFFRAELVQNDHQSFDPPVVSGLLEFEVAQQEDCVGGTTNEPGQDGAGDGDTGTTGASPPQAG